MNSSEDRLVTCFGEILWDLYPEGKQLGGAPFNVAAHLHKLGTRSQIISRVGQDALGEDIIAAAEQQGVQPIFIQKDDTLATGIVKVTLDEGGVPSYDIALPSAWDKILLTEANKQLVRRSFALVYGTLALRSKDSYDTLLELLKLSPLNICDLNIRQDYYSKDLITELLGQTHILKINDEESDLLKTMFDLSSDSFYPDLTTKFPLSVIIKTMGKDGAEVWKDGKIYRGQSIKKSVKDTVGSGDAFLAAFIHNYLSDMSLLDCVNEACKLGAYVATRSGAIPDYDVDKL